MGAYIYRLKGTRAFEEFIIEGRKQKVYDYVYWYKPYYTGIIDEMNVYSQYKPFNTSS
jgi:hypothetical protein